MAEENSQNASSGSTLLWGSDLPVTGGVQAKMTRLGEKGCCRRDPAIPHPLCSPRTLLPCGMKGGLVLCCLIQSPSLKEAALTFSGLSEHTAYPKIAQNICLCVSGLHSFDDLLLSIKKISACTPHPGIRPYEIHVYSSFSVYILYLKYSKS